MPEESSLKTVPPPLRRLVRRAVQVARAVEDQRRLGLRAVGKAEAVEGCQAAGRVELVDRTVGAVVTIRRAVQVARVI